MWRMKKSRWIYEIVKLKEINGLGDCLDVEAERGVKNYTCISDVGSWVDKDTICWE